MESGISILRFLLLVLILSAYCLKAEALSVSRDGRQVPVFFLHEAVVENQSANTGINKPVKVAPPLIILTLLPYQGQIAQLSWTTDATLPGIFYVERLAATSGWVVIRQFPYDASPVYFYNDTISFPYCTSTNFTYRIRFISATDNVTSLTESTSLSDLNSPADVQNLNVSITPNRFPVITWTPVTGDDISGYRIQRYDGNAWPIVANITDGSNSFVDQSVSDVCDKSYRYIVVTIDRCLIPSAPVYEKQFVQTLMFESSQPGQCERFSKLSWNSYNNMPGGLGGYKVYRSDGSATVEISDTRDTAIIDNHDFKAGLTYTYSLKAYSSGNLYSSSSCFRGWPYNAAIKPDTVYITQVSVEDDSYIKVGYHLHPDGSVVKLILQRSDNGGTNFQAIDSIPKVSGVVPQNHFFIDSMADVHRQSYYYRLVAIDTCGFRTFSLNTSRSIWLQCTTSETQNTLDWNSYEYWLKGVKEYDIYRILNGEPSTEIVIGNAGQATVSYSEPLANYDVTKAACYWVEGNENPGGFQNNAISVSNTCCITKEPVLFVPNAFNPEGTNKRFRPVPIPLYIDVQSFKMIIFSRWGQQLYETTDIVNGWDGRVNGQAFPAGLYGYLLTYKSPEGKEYTKRGTVVLVR